MDAGNLPLQVVLADQQHATFHSTLSSFICLQAWTISDGLTVRASTRHPSNQAWTTSSGSSRVRRSVNHSGHTVIGLYILFTINTLTHVGKILFHSLYANHDFIITAHRRLLTDVYRTSNKKPPCLRLGNCDCCAQCSMMGIFVNIIYLLDWMVGIYSSGATQGFSPGWSKIPRFRYWYQELH